MMRGNRAESGVTLLELVLTVIMLGFIVILTTRLMQGWASEERSRAGAEYIGLVDRAVTQLVENFDEFNIVYDVVQQNAGNLQIPLLPDGGSPISVAEGGTNLNMTDGTVRDLGGSNLITPSFVARNPFKGDVLVVVRTADAPATGNERALEFLIVTNDRQMENVVRSTSSLIGGAAGYISDTMPTDGTGCLTGDCSTTVRSAFGDWNLDVADFSGTAWYGAIMANPPSAADGSYIVMFRFIGESVVTGDYLYRTPQPSHPELNRMSANLDMNMNNIVGADNLLIGQDAYSKNYFHAQGSIIITGENTLSQANLTVEGDLGAGLLLIRRPYPDSETRIPNPNDMETQVQIEGDFETNDLDVRRNMRVGGTTPDGVNNVQATTANVTNLNAGTVTAGTMTAASLTADSVGGGTLNAANVTANNVAADIADIDDMTVNGGFTGTVVNASRMNISRLTQCLNGC